MPWPAQVLVIAALLCGAAGSWATYAAWPRLKALERRGVIITAVPELPDERLDTWRMMKLIWTAPVPADRKTLRRLLQISRWSQVLGLLLVVAAMVVGQALPPTLREDHRVERAPPVVLLPQEPVR